jgi:hypothetical protein
MINDKKKLFESSDITALEFCLWGWMKLEVNKKKKKVNTRDKIVVCILYAKLNVDTFHDSLFYKPGYIKVHNDEILTKLSLL